MLQTLDPGCASGQASTLCPGGTIPLGLWALGSSPRSTVQERQHSHVLVWPQVSALFWYIETNIRFCSQS